jgi:hypothetical protein
MTISKKFYSVAKDAYYRCYNPKYGDYHRYGGRGITVEFASRAEFADYIKDLPGYEPGKSIDRIDNDGNYAPGNLRWVTRYEQEANKGMIVTNTSGIKYLRRVTSDKAWRVEITREYRKTSKSFADKKFGSEEASKQAAISYLEELLEMCQI